MIDAESPSDNVPSRSVGFMLYRSIKIVCLASLSFAMHAVLCEAFEPTRGPLVAHPENPRWFADRDGRAVYLIGSHTWANFQDLSLEGEKLFDHEAWLDFMEEHRFNFQRFWIWEHATWASWTAEKLHVDPVPYRRTGPTDALDGKPQFNLDAFEPVYFDRMRARVMDCRDRGIYCAVMLFQAFSSSKKGKGNPFRGHPLNVRNNLQIFDGDVDGNDVVDWDSPAVRAWQVAFIHKVVDTLNDLDNVLYEVINEGGTEDWQKFVVKTVRDHEKKLPKQHLWGHGIDPDWVWKCFVRGHHVLFMDPWSPIPRWQDEEPFDGVHYSKNHPNFPGYQESRSAMRCVSELAATLDLSKATPTPELATSGFCLASPNDFYVVFIPNGGEVVVDLTGSQASYSATWLAPITGQHVRNKKIEGGKKVPLSSPFSGSSVVLVKRENP
jgi:hypothetical protein